MCHTKIGLWAKVHPFNVRVFDNDRNSYNKWGLDYPKFRVFMRLNYPIWMDLNWLYIIRLDLNIYIYIFKNHL
jgi:hypothetical protein